MKRENTKKAKPNRLLEGVRRVSGELLGSSFVEWRGRGELVVGGAKSIGCLSEQRIVVVLVDDRLLVCGHALICRSFQNETLVIGGRIDSVSYEEGRV